MSLLVNRSVFVLAAAMIAHGLFSLEAFAKTARLNASEIVAHLPGQGVLATQLTVKIHGSRTYLYVYEAGGDVLTAIDVTKPDKPVVLGHTSKAGGLEEERIGSIAVVRQSGRPTTNESAETKTRFLDLSDPEHPRPIPELDGATGMTTDRMRGYLFVVNEKGLWVIHDDSLVDPGVRAWYDFANAP